MRRVTPKFVGALFLLDGLPFAFIVLARRGRAAQPNLRAYTKKRGPVTLVPVATVDALLGTSVLFAALSGVWLQKERFTWRRAVGTLASARLGDGAAVVLESLLLDSTIGSHMLGKLHCRLRDNQRIQICARENRRPYGKAGAFHNGFAQMNCWICGACNAGTREHRVKASDLKSLFGTPNQKAPLYLNSTARQRNVRIGSLKSDRLKYKQPICLACNSARTQPHDEAWRHASDKLRGNVPRLLRRGSFRSNWLFPHNTRLGMRYLHLYFVKLFGCQIVEGNIPIDIAPFAKAILDGRPHPGLFIGFGHLSGLPKKFAGGSDVLVKCLNGEVVCASWFYQVGDLCVKVMYATLGEHPDGLKTAWNPRQGSKRLFFVTL